MTQVDITSLQQRARRGGKHLQRFANIIIPTTINALLAAGLTVEQRYTNQCLINNRWVGCYRHPDPAAGKQSRIVIYDGNPVSGVLVAEIYNEADAKLFAAAVKLGR
jgi:hypothetical protein